MKHGGLIKKFGRSILDKIPHKKDRGKANQKLQTALPLIYAGTWLFIDDLSQKHHKLEITVDLNILIDSHELPGKMNLRWFFWTRMVIICKSLPKISIRFPFMTKQTIVHMIYQNTTSRGFEKTMPQIEKTDICN